MISSFFINAGFSIAGLIMMALLLIIYILKRKNWSITSTVFFSTILITVLILCFSILSSYTIINRELYPTFNNIVCRIYMFLNILWFFMSTGYIIVMFMNKDDKKKVKTFLIIYLCIAIITSLLFSLLYDLTFDVCVDGKPCGIAGHFQTIITIISMLSSAGHALILTINKKKIKNVNISPVFFLGAVYYPAAIFLILKHINLNILSVTLALTVTILFFTIENQDSLLLDEYENMKEESVKSGKAKTNFLVDMSHEIRTPLTTILGFSQTLLYKENLSEDILKKDLTSIKKANNTLLNLINSLFDISKLESNKEIINENDYSLESLIFEIYSYIPPKILKENLKFNINVNPEIPKKYYGDASKIFKAVSYVILNAIEYTNYGEVSLTVDAHQKAHADYELEFIVSNTGHAMKEEKFNLDFDDYLELSDKSSDVNLVLIIAKKIVTLLNGTIEFINRAGQGTKYIIKINQKNYSPDKMGNIFANHTHTGFTSDFLDCRDKRVLIVDDKPENLSIMSEFLENYGFEIFTARNGREAISSIQKQRYDMVFLDNRLPDMDGIGVMKSLKSLLQNVPRTVLLVNNNEAKDASAYIEEGFIDCLTKPIIFKNLNKLIVKNFDDKK